MRILCAFQGHRWETIRQEWLPKKDEKDHISLLRFDECQHCHDVRATITHPEDYKSRFSMATRAFHRSTPEDAEPGGV